MRVYTHGGLGTLTASQHNIFDSEKLTNFSYTHGGWAIRQRLSTTFLTLEGGGWDSRTFFLCSWRRRGFEPGGLSISSPTLYQTEPSRHPRKYWWWWGRVMWVWWSLVMVCCSPGGSSSQPELSRFAGAPSARMEEEFVAGSSVAWAETSPALSPHPSHIKQVKHAVLLAYWAYIQQFSIEPTGNYYVLIIVYYAWLKTVVQNLLHSVKTQSKN